MAKKSTMQAVLDQAAKFVTRQEGVWGHQEWEALVGELADLGLEMDHEARRNLGNLLEAAKYFRNAEAAAAGTKPAKRTRAAKSESEAKPKKKAAKKSK